MLKYPCLVLDHDDTVVQSEATVNYPYFVYILDRFRPGKTITLRGEQAETFVRARMEIGSTNAQRMQRQLEENKKKLEETDFTVTSGGGAVRLTVSGARVVKDLQIDPEAVDPDDVEMLQDMLVIAFNDAMKQIDEASEKLTGGMGMGL